MAKILKKKKSLAIIPARGGSKRIPKKNIRNFMGYPIIKYSIDSALKSGCFDEVMVSTDDKEIARLAKSFGASVPFMRSMKNASDYATTSDVIEEVLENYKKKKGKVFEAFCCIYPTALFVEPSLLRQAHAHIQKDNVEEAITAVKFRHPIERAFKVEEGYMRMIRPETENLRSQDFEVCYYDAGQFYYLKTDKFLANKFKTMFLKNTVPVEISELRVQDINDEDDWKLAEAKYVFRKRLL